MSVDHADHNDPDESGNWCEHLAVVMLSAAVAIGVVGYFIRDDSHGATPSGPSPAQQVQPVLHQGYDNNALQPTPQQSQEGNSIQLPTWIPRESLGYYGVNLEGAVLDSLPIALWYDRKVLEAKITNRALFNRIVTDYHDLKMRVPEHGAYAFLDHEHPRFKGSRTTFDKDNGLDAVHYELYGTHRSTNEIDVLLYSTIVKKISEHHGTHSHPS